MKAPNALSLVGRGRGQVALPADAEPDGELWFALSPVGMVLFDPAGRILRANAAFGAMVGAVPTSLDDAPANVARLLAWDDAQALARLQPGGAALEAHSWAAPAGASWRPLRATLRCHLAAAGARRYTAVVEDRSVEEERDLAQMQIGTLMGTAEVGIATFQESSGWVRQRTPERTPASSAAASVLQNISRDLVAAESLADYETLQRALRSGEAADVRYAIEHPELGRRWLQTRVEPARLASGKRTTSVVTLDITDRLQTKAKSEQLLREMTTILESSTAGIAYLRAGALVRCNRRFETMLGGTSSAPAGAPLAALLAAHDDSGEMAQAIATALAEGQTYENEFAAAASVIGTGVGPRWYSLAVRSAGSGSAADEAIAVLTDVSRLKAQQRELEALARDRQLAEQAVAEQAERTRSILDSVLVGIVIVGAHGIEWMNRSARRMFGGALADFEGRPIAVVATPDPAHPFRQAHYLDQLTAGQAETFECTVRARDGREFRVVGNAVATDDGSGGRQLTYALLDIERRRQAEAAVTQAQASLRRVIEAAPLAIALLDAATLAVVQVNAVAAATVGAAPEALLGKAPEAIFPPLVAAARRRDMAAALAARDVSTFEYRFLSRDGRSEVWDARYLPLSDGSGARPDQLLLVATDVSAQRAAEAARFAEAIAQRDMLVKEVHHRIKNNLQGVAGLLQQIAQRKPEVSGVIDEVVGQVQAIAQVYGLQVGSSGPLPLVGVFEAIAGSVQRTFGVAIECAVDGDAAGEWTLPEVEAIPIALTLNELLTNAVKHSPVLGTSIACRLFADADEVRVSISNRASLRAGFDIDAIPNGVSGLGLVRALLPRRSASLALAQRGEHVEAVVTLRAPSVVRAGIALAQGEG